MKIQEAADAFAEKLNTTMKTNESKTRIKLKDHEKIVSLKIRETNFKAIKLSELCKCSLGKFNEK